MSEFVVRNIILPYRIPQDEAILKAKERVRKFVPSSRVISAEVNRRSVDARKKSDIKFIYSVIIRTDIQLRDDELKECDAFVLKSDSEEIRNGNVKLNGRPLIAGMGPCGMFAALTLAKRGYKPLVIERGKSADERKKDIDIFFSERILDENSNIQFGAGGAGTFSDGKLITRINDSKCRKVLETLVMLGAPREILTAAKPHIGTDKLLGIVRNAENEIRRYGGEILYSTTLKEIRYTSGNMIIAETDRGEIQAPLLVLATGHSSRDTYYKLIDNGFEIVPKDFSCGVRIEHLASDIDYAMYGNADLSILGHAEYNLSYRRGDKGVYSFCMCPGGQVIAASSEAGGVVVNGMSYYNRDMLNSNSAIAVSVNKSDYGADPKKAIEFQRSIERKAFSLGGGDYCVPVQTVGNFLGKTSNSEITRVTPSYMDGNSYKIADLASGLPQFIVAMLKTGLSVFNGTIHGFASDSAVLSGYETRTSAPVRIVRADDMRAVGKGNVYPCGEGAGYAGGITSAALDGMKVAEKIIGEYSPG